MKIFKGFNEKGPPCLVCNTHEDKKCTLVGIVGTEDEGNMEASVVHTDCLELYYYPSTKIIAMKI